MNYCLMESKTREDTYKTLPMTTLDSLEDVTDIVELLRIVKRRKYPDYKVKFVALTNKEAEKHNALYKWLYD